MKIDNSYAYDLLFFQAASVLWDLAEAVYAVGKQDKEIYGPFSKPQKVWRATVLQAIETRLRCYRELRLIRSDEQERKILEVVRTSVLKDCEKYKNLEEFRTRCKDRAIEEIVKILRSGFDLVLS